MSGIDLSKKKKKEISPEFMRMRKRLLELEQKDWKKTKRTSKSRISPALFTVSSSTASSVPLSSQSEDRLTQQLFLYQILS